MTFKDYQKKSRKTALYPDNGDNFIYPALGLAGEAGEVSDKIKKVLRDKGGQVDNETREALKKELGDVLWYVAQLSTELDIDLEDVARGNIDKLFKRLDTNTINGDGDDR